jgi:hypothetical protein
MGKQGKPAGNMGAAQFSRQKLAQELLVSLMGNSSYNPQDKNQSQKGQTTDSEWLCKSCEKNNFVTRRVCRGCGAHKGTAFGGILPSKASTRSVSRSSETAKTRRKWLVVRAGARRA